MTTTTPTDPRPSPRRPSRRLRALLALAAAVLGVYGFAQLDRSVAERFGPAGEFAHDLLRPTVADRQADSRAARRFKADVLALHGTAIVAVIKPGVLGIFGREELYGVSARTPQFDDAALARLAGEHGARISQLDLCDTGVTDAGMRHLGRFPQLRHLSIRAGGLAGTPGGPPPGAPAGPITDAGLAHLRGLAHLWSLDLGGQPVTDAGLAAVRGASLTSLYLDRTGVRGTGVRGLPGINVLVLDGDRVTEDGLRALAAEPDLQFLSLRQVPLDGPAVPLLLAIPRLKQLEIAGCGFLEAEIAALMQGKPGLRIIRQ